MSVGSRVNPNYPIPGLDQSSKGFRDNFAIIKRELEGLQGTTIQLIGGVTSDPFEIGNSGSMVISTAINGDIISISPPGNAVQFNKTGFLKGDARFVFDDFIGAVGIGTSIPNEFSKLDVRGSVRFEESMLIRQPTPSGSAIISMTTPTGNLAIINTGASSEIGTVTITPFRIITSSTARMTISPAGNVGIGSNSPTVSLDVKGSYSDIARFTNGLNLVDSMIRARTTTAGSTVGWGLEHMPSNRVGGIRLDSGGTVSIHSGESAGADLSSSSARMSIDSNGKVGIGSSIPAYNLDVNGTFRSAGITDDSDNVSRSIGINNRSPYYELDVVGDIATSGAIVSTHTYILAGTTTAIIDAWSMDTYRSARYTVQVSLGVDPSEQVDIDDYMVIHANGVAIGRSFNSMSSGVTPLGSLSVSQSGNYAELYYTGVAANNVVRLSKTYIVK